MDVKKYEVLISVIEKKSILNACIELGYTQSGITHMMNSMEKEIGFPILQRSNKGVKLTSEGRIVLPLIRQIVKLNAELEYCFSQIRGLETGKVRVGSYPSIACTWLPKIIPEFRRLYPGVQVEISEELRVKQLERNLSEGHLDLCFLSRQPQQPFEYMELLEDPYYAVLPSNHPLAANEVIEAEALMHENFFINKSIDGIDPDILRYWEKIDVPITSTCSCNTDHTIVKLVSMELGVSMLPRLFLDTAVSAADQVQLRPLHPPAYRTLGIAAPSFPDLSPVAKAFLQCAKSVLANEGK